MPTRSEIMDLIVVELSAMRASLPTVVSEDLSFRQDLGLDSLAIVEFVARMELRFRVEIPDPEWKELVTLGLVASYIEGRLSS
jgi:acyl carrier protein